MGKKTPIGIDLGTTYSCVGVFQHGKVEIIANDQGNRTTPSYVAFTDTERLIGDAAKNQVAMNPTNTIFDAKRLIGRNFSDSSVQSDMKHWPFKVRSEGGKPRLEVEYKQACRRYQAGVCPHDAAQRPALSRRVSVAFARSLETGEATEPPCLCQVRPGRSDLVRLRRGVIRLPVPSPKI